MFPAQKPVFGDAKSAINHLTGEGGAPAKPAMAGINTQDDGAQVGDVDSAVADLVAQYGYEEVKAACDRMAAPEGGEAAPVEPEGDEGAPEGGSPFKE